MVSKYYTNRDDLYDDMEFIYDLRIPYEVKQQLLDELFELWKYQSTDSPWFKRPDKQELDAAETLVKISEDGQSSEWIGEHIVFESVQLKSKSKSKKSKKHTYNLRNL
jgi:hypothetical protein